MSFDENKKFWEEFIAIFKDNPCLWCSKSKEYRNRPLKNEAYDKLVDKAKEVKSDADKEYVIRKINTMRACFRRQFRKINGAILKGTEDVPQPTLWYYDLLMFTAEDNGINEKIIIPSKEFDMDVKIKEEEAAEDEDIDNHTYTEESSRSQSPVPIVTKTSKRKHTTEIKYEPIKKPTLADSSSRFPQEDDESENEWEIYGKSIGVQIKGLDKYQAIIAQKLFSDVIFNAKMGNLRCDSYVQLSPLSNRNNLDNSCDCSESCPH